MPKVRQWPRAGQQEVPKRTVSKPQEKAPKQLAAKGKPSESKAGRIEAAMKALGQEHSDACLCLEELLKKAKVEEVSAPNVSSRPPDVSVAESPREDGPARGISGSSGPRRRRRKASPGGSIVEGPSPRNSGTRGAATGRVREILRTGGQASRESTGRVTEALKAQTQRGGGVGGGAAPLGGTSCRSCCPARTKPPYDARD